ncbi:uncharacterized protein V1516DRAFT_679886 [Lipomyces oligophaga]|uniref:uncharacterized protein n=1 Tax=Lipomyces oligophaga TaxID=45792 RepID=UPI0034CD14FF
MPTWIQTIFSGSSSNSEKRATASQQASTSQNLLTAMSDGPTSTEPADSLDRILRSPIDEIAASAPYPGTVLEPANAISHDEPATVFGQAKEITMTHPILIGVAITAIALLARAGLNTAARASTGAVAGNKKFLKGGFNLKMDKSEALQILGMTDGQLSKAKLKEQHRRIMLLNHPDRGGSPYVASKINEAKDLLERSGRLR